MSRQRAKREPLYFSVWKEKKTSLSSKNAQGAARATRLILSKSHLSLSPFSITGASSPSANSNPMKPTLRRLTHDLQLNRHRVFHESDLLSTTQITNASLSFFP